MDIVMVAISSAFVLGIASCVVGCIGCLGEDDDYDAFPRVKKALHDDKIN